MKRTMVLALAIIAVLPLWAESFIVDDYSMTISIDSSRSMMIREDMALDYTVPSHGFFRDIQYAFRDGTRADVDGMRASEEAVVSRDSSMISVRFGSPDETVLGRKEYSLAYRYSLGADGYDDYDELYFNIVAPDAWDAPMRRVSFSVTFPYPLGKDRIWVTSGAYGSRALQPFSLSPDGRTVSGSFRDLPPGEGITLRAEMDEGYFDTAVRPSDYTAPAFMLSLSASIVMLAVSAAVWYAKGRPGRIIAPVRFDPPEGLSPMDAGYAYDGRLSDSDAAAMLIWWADRGYVSIQDSGGDDFVFTRLRQLPPDAPEAEAALFSAFFRSSGSVSPDTLRVNGFASAMQRVRKAEVDAFSGEKSLSDPGAVRLRKRMLGLLIIPAAIIPVLLCLPMPEITAFALVPAFMAYLMLRSFSLQNAKAIALSGLRPSMAAGPLLFLLFLVFFMSAALSGTYGMARAAIASSLFLLSLALSVLLSSLIDRRSRYGDSVMMQVLGYREFIDKVERDRIEKLSKEDPEFFYHVLSYAMALGLEREWTEAFRGITVPPASWYDCPPGSGIYGLSSFPHRWHHAYSSIIAPRSGGSGMRTSRGSSGFTGGGYSGGGGRSW